MSIYVTLRYDDPRAAIAYLTGTLGFVEQNVHTADDGTVGHAGHVRHRPRGRLSRPGIT
jgi:uncharacterized glyoxalase superfamily protein PhnB